MDGHAQADPKFKSIFSYTRITARAVREKLIAEKGYTDEQLPCRQTIGNILNRMGYRFERCWAVLENYWNGGILDSVEATINWASNMTWKGNHPQGAFSTRSV